MNMHRLQKKTIPVNVSRWTCQVKINGYLLTIKMGVKIITKKIGIYRKDSIKQSSLLVNSLWLPQILCIQFLYLDINTDACSKSPSPFPSTIHNNTASRQEKWPEF